MANPYNKEPTETFVFHYRNFERKEKEVHESIQNEQIRTRRLEGYAAAEKRLSDKKKTLCFVNSNECVGEYSRSTNRR